MTKNKIVGLLLTVMATMCIFVSTTSAQAVYGSIAGVVTDSSNAVVPGATVTITSVDRKTVDTVTTNEEGYYSKERLLPGKYEVKVEKQNFKTGATSIQVSVDTQNKANIELTAGNVSEVVTIESDSEQLKTDRADVSTTFSNREVTELPILDRNFTKLILLTPGTQQQLWGHAASENPQGSTQTIVNGQTFSGTGYQLDGTDNRDVILGIIVINPTFESVGETKITSSNYDAEFGQAIAGVASVQTKSGTNSFRGSAFEYLQRDRFQARNPFSQKAPDPITKRLIPKTSRDQFGGSIGGPIVKNKLFFFGDYQGTRAKQGGSKPLTVPTALARTGNLSEYLVRNSSGTIISGQAYNPSTGLAYTNNIIPACGAGQTSAANGCLSAQALNLLALLPTPTSAGINDNFVASGSETFNNDIFNVRGDARISEKFNMFGRFSRAKFALTGPTAFGKAGGPELVSLGGTSKTRNISLATGFDYTVNGSTVVDFRFGFFNYKVNVLPFDYNTTTATTAGIPGLNNDAFSSGLFAGFINTGTRDINFGSGLGVNRCNCPLDQDEKQYQFVVNLTKIVGNHSLKFGTDLRRAFNLRVPSDKHRSGELTFGANRTALFTPATPTTPATLTGGIGLASFLIGDVTEFSRYVSTSTTASERQWRHYYYGQDTFRATPKLTLALGLRADIINPQSLNAAGNAGFVNLTTGKIDVAGVGSTNLSGNIKNHVNFAPRIGVAYQINDKMVIRGGFGRSFDTGVFGTVFGHTVTQNLPVLAVQNLNTTSTGRVFNLATGPSAPAGLFGITTAANACPLTGCVNNTAIPSSGSFFIPDGVTVRALTDKQTLPRVDAYNITFQWEFAKNMSLEAAYVGNKGTNVFVGDNPDLNINQASIAGFTPGRNTNLAKPFFQKFGWSQDISLYQGYKATNRYDSLQLKLTKRFSQGYSFLTHYTLQKAVNNSGQYFNIDPSVNRGKADFEKKHNFVLSQLFELPFGRNHKFLSGIGKAADAFIGGWQINSNTTIQSGYHFNVGYNDKNDRDTGPNRPNLTGKATYPGTQLQYISAAGFTKPGVGTFGSLKRNALTGPGYWKTDASLLKKFKFNETMNVEFRIEVVNLFNNVNLGNPDSNLGDYNATNGTWSNAGTGGTFGKITSTAFFGNDLQRNLQFAFRFNF